MIDTSIVRLHSKWSVHHAEPEAVDRKVAGRVNQQDSCGCGYQWVASQVGADAW
jgi:hypothetical protein